MRSNPRPVAQRPLPSMMIATWRGNRVGSMPWNGRVARLDLTIIATSHHHDLVFLGLQGAVDALDPFVGQGLHLVQRMPGVVFGYLLLFLQLLDQLVGVAAVVPRRYAIVLGDFFDV